MSGTKRELEDEDEDEKFDVETLVAKSVSLKTKNVHYLVKWTG